MKIGRGVSELWGVENRPLPLTWPMAYTTACTTVQAVITPTRGVTMSDAVPYAVYIVAVPILQGYCAPAILSS